MSRKLDFGHVHVLFFTPIILWAMPLSAQLLSQSTTAFSAYARPGLTPGGSLLSFNEILRQRTEGSEVKQCPCITLPGANRCISYDSRFQAASLEEAILTFVDTSMNPTLFDDHVGPPLGASAFTCATPACRQCAALLALRIRQVGISTTLPNFGFPLPDINELDPSQCRRLRLSRSVPARLPPVPVPGYMAQTIENALNFLERTRNNEPRSAFGQAVDAVIALSKQYRGRAFVEAVLGQSAATAAVSAGRGTDSRSSTSGNQPSPGVPASGGSPNGNPGGGNRGSGRPRPRWPTNMPAPVVRPLLRRMQNRNPQQPQPQRPQQNNGQQQSGQQFPQQPGQRPNQNQFQQQQQSQGQSFVQSPQPQFNQQQSQQFGSQPQGFQPQGQQPGFQPQSQQFVPQSQGFQPGAQQPQQFFPQQPGNAFRQVGMAGVQQPLTASLVHQGVDAISNFIPNPSAGQASPSSGAGSAAGSGGFGHIGGAGGGGSGFGVPGFGSGNGNTGGGSNFGGGFGFGRKKRAAESSQILGNRFIISCVERGDSENEETDYINLCTACWTWRQLPADYFPRLINELVCNENDFCLSGFGACHQRYRNVDVLHRGPNGWQPTTISVAACCDCKVRAGTDGHSLVVGSRGNT